MMQKIKFEHLCLWSVLILAPVVRPMKAEAAPIEPPTIVESVSEPFKSLPELRAVQIAEVELKPVEPPILQPQPLLSISIGSTKNLFQPGQCVWHVKNLKPEIPNSLGSAYQWISRGKAMGWPMGSVPKVGAAGVRGTHAVYVKAVYDNGTILISEMNYDWVPFHQREIIKPANAYTYLY